MKNKVQLIAYADRLGDGTLSSMTDILRTRFDGVYDGVHILPFFTPFDGADAGFDPIDHTKVDPRLGSWDDVAELSKTHGIMVDAIVNHMSWESKQFQDVLEKGEESEYYPMFLTMSSVFPNGATEEELAGIYRPRPGLPFTHYKFAGKTRLVWVSFTRSRLILTPIPTRAGNTSCPSSIRWPHPTSATFASTPSATALRKPAPVAL